VRRQHYLSPEQAARVYDRIGRWQDTQAFYERQATDLLTRLGRFDSATSVVEIGCGTGAFAAGLLTAVLPQKARYVGLDVSPRMVGLARRRLAPWSDRAEVLRVDGQDPWPAPDGGADRVVATYVLDLLSPEAIAAFLDEAARVLRPDGLLLTAGLAPGPGGLPRLVSDLWTQVWRLDPRLTGGCRPLDPDAGRPPGWSVQAERRVTSWGITSSVVVARPEGGQPGPA
jgi:SAM-dependent methyltransferase